MIHEKKGLGLLVFFSGLMYSEIRGILALKMHNGAKRCVLTRFRSKTVKTLKFLTRYVFMQCNTTFGTICCYVALPPAGEKIKYLLLL